jgi:hypothetical protein
MRLLAQMIVGFESEMMVLPAIAKFVAGVCERDGEQRGATIVAALGIEESLTGLIDCTDDRIAGLAEVLIELAKQTS